MVAIERRRCEACGGSGRSGPGGGPCLMCEGCGSICARCKEPAEDCACGPAGLAVELARRLDARRADR